MRVYFNEKESLVIEAENITEKIALEHWFKLNAIQPTPHYSAIKTDKFLIKFVGVVGND